MLSGQVSVPDHGPSGEPVAVADAVVYVREARLGRLGTRGHGPPDAEMVERGAGLTPGVMVVPRGATVTFRNRDSVFHEPFSISPARHFVLRGFRPGEVRPVAFDTAGVVQIYCRLHPEPAGYVLVMSHGAYTRPDATGHFVLPPVPRGHYSLEAWHPGLGAKSRPIEVRGGRRQHVELKF